METKEVLKMLKERMGGDTVDDFSHKVNKTLQLDNNDERMKVITLKAYVTGKRQFQAHKGIRILARYFKEIGDYEMLDALSEYALGIPYPRPENGKK